MSNSFKSLAFATLLLTTAVAAQPNRQAVGISPEDPVAATYTPGGQYTATFYQTRNHWRLQPANGQDVVIDAGACANGAMVPAGVWLLVIGDAGRPELVAPSVTHLPAGSSDRIGLRSCDRAQGRELAVPQTVLDLLAINTGAIYVID